MHCPGEAFLQSSRKNRSPHPITSSGDPRRGATHAISSEPVTHSIKRFDHVKALVDGPKPVPQPLDVAINGALVNIELLIVRSAQERVATLNCIGSTRERLEDQELCDCQRYRVTFPSTRLAFRIHIQMAARERSGRAILV